MNRDLDLSRLRALTQRIAFKALEHRPGYGHLAHDAFAEIEDWADEAERIVIHLQQESTQLTKENAELREDAICWRQNAELDGVEP